MVSKHHPSPCSSTFYPFKKKSFRRHRTSYKVTCKIVKHHIQIIVEFEGEEVKKVVESTHRISYFSFQGPEGLFGVLESYFQKYDIYGEVLVGNYFGIAVPVDMSDEGFNSIIENSPVLLNARIE